MKITLKKCKFATYEIATNQKFAEENTNKKKSDPSDSELAKHTICDR